MVIDIKMCRFEDGPWGFRLVGGSDYDYPLTVVKVTEGSIAEEAGLRAGDVIVRINDTPSSPLTHDESDKLIRGCGNVFYFGVQREDDDEDEDEPENIPQRFPLLGTERIATPDSIIEERNFCKSPISEVLSEDFRDQEYIPELPDRPCSVLSENSEIKLVEEEIAAVLSGETEVLKDHNTLGIFPKPGVCMASDVLRTLNDEATKTKAEKDKENKKWSTFLQRPDRPIPKSKQQLEAERRAANAYKVKIVKSEPRSSRSVTPAVPSAPAPEPEKVATPPKEPTPPQPIEEEPLPTDSEVPNLEEVAEAEVGSNNEPENTTDEEKIDKEKETVLEAKENVEETTAISQAEVDSTAANVEEVNEPVREKRVSPEKTEEELALERQLADVQKQLAALSSLPSTIQSTLDAVTKQLADLLPTFKLQQINPQNAPEQTREISLEKIDESAAEAEEGGQRANGEATGEEMEKEDIPKSVEGTEQKEKTNSIILKKDDKNELGMEKEDKSIDEEQNLKKEKRQTKYDVIEELEEHLERKSNPRRSKRAFGPLTPQSDRPLVLPGGRRWYRPKDAYNDEFIAETLIAQAELITGTTLGVNFMKYQKPERKIDLNRSEVYKIIHHLDRQPVRGIEVRPPVVPAEADIRGAVQS